MFQKLHDKKLNLERHLKPVRITHTNTQTCTETQLFELLIIIILQLLYQCRRSHHSKEVMSKNILLNADVVCCTLSTSGRGLLSWSVWRKYCNMYSLILIYQNMYLFFLCHSLKKSPLHFSCVIIDEVSVPLL